MKYIKRFESWYSDDDDDGRELMDSLKKLKDKIRTVKVLTNLHRRQTTPDEIFEDYFLEFKECEKFYVKIYKDHTDGVGPINIVMENILDESNIESEFHRLLNKLKSIQKRIEVIEHFQCHFSIALNGKSQADLDPIKHQNNDYKFKGVGEEKCGYDGKGKYYSERVPTLLTINHRDEKFPEGKVAVKINFYIV